MKIAQILKRHQSEVCFSEGGDFFTLSSPEPISALELVYLAEESLADAVLRLVKVHGKELLGSEDQIFSRFLKPLNAPEIWAVGVSYRRQALEHDDDLEKRTGKTDQLYQFVYYNQRAEVFFKGFDRSCRGPGEEVLLRADSEQILPEAELVLVLGKNGRPVGVTFGNDLTAWDIERECPLYLNQAKIWDSSCSIGPFIYPIEEVDPYDLELVCIVERRGERVIESVGATRDIKRSIEELCYYLRFNNSTPAGSLLFTGTACVIPHDFTLEQGDIVSVGLRGEKLLSNKVKRASFPPKNFKLRE